MPAEQGNNRNKVKKLCIYALLVAVCSAVSYLESFIPLSFVAPGIKLGLANSVALLLIAKRNFKGAYAVNITRILLSSLIFGSFFSLIFALSAGVVSLTATALCSKIKSFSVIGLSVIGGVVHNAVQLLVAYFVTDKSVLLYTPVLIVGGVVCGIAAGTLCNLILKKVKTNYIF